MRATASLLAALLSTGMVTPAFAAAPAVGAPAAAARSAADRARAEAKYEQGVDAYDRDRFADAVRLFLEADAISPSAALSYNIARAYEKLSDDAQTLRWYRNYLRLSPNAANAAEVRGFVRTYSRALAKKGIQQVTLLSTPAGATVAIDGKALGVTPLTTELSPGSHGVLLSRRGFSDASAQFTLAAAEPLAVTVELHELPKDSSNSDQQEPARRFGVAPWVTLGAAAACLGGAAIFEIARNSAQNSAETDRVQVDYERDFKAVDSRQTTARVLLGVGGVLAAAGTTLLVLNTRTGPESRAVVSSVPGGASLAWERRF